MRDFLERAGAYAWLVGGTVRDLLLGHEPADIDLATEGAPDEPARRFADSIGGSFFILSEEFQACRVISADRGSTYDFTACRGGEIAADLGLRDFTANAIAAGLADLELIDPFDGLDAIKGRYLAEVSQDVFDHDPLRLLRAVRLEKQLGFRATDSLAALMRDRSHLASLPAVERIFTELSRLLEAPGAAAAVRRLDELELLEVLLPEIHALKGVVQNEYHHLDVYDHMLEVVEGLDRIIADPAAYFPAHADELAGRFNSSIAGDASWRFVMSFAALMHDVAKPSCKFTDQAGDIRFFEHDRLGAELAVEILGRLHASTRATQAISLLVRRHMRFEALKHEYPPSTRVRLRYARATEPFTPEAIILSVADQLAVRGPKTTEAAIQRHLELAREMMDLSLAADERQPLPKLVGGDELMAELNLEPGPTVGELLDRIHEEQALGNIDTRQEALELAARILEEEKA